MNSSSSDGAVPPRILTGRLAAALAASLAAHAAAIALFPPQPGAACCELSFATATEPMRARLRLGLPPEEQPAPEVEPPAALPPGRTAAPEPSPRTAVPEPRYYTSRELDGVPAPYSAIEPAYPEAAARRQLGGKIRIRLYIDESGAVERVWVLDAEPPGYFEEAVARAFGAARFTPGIKDGRPVKSQLALEVNFEPPPLPAMPGG